MKNKMMERAFFGGVIHQRIDSQMLSVSDLSKIYESIRKDKGWSRKDINEFFRNSKDKEFIIELVKEANLVNTDFFVFMEVVEKKGIITALKEFDLYSMKGRGDNRQVFCHPYIFVSIAMWMHPLFRAKTTVWITDQLIMNRIEAGERFNLLSKAIHDHIVPSIESESGKKFIYSNFAKLINKKVFGAHADDLRQIASKDDLGNLNELQIELGALIKYGSITSYQEAKSYIESL